MVCGLGKHFAQMLSHLSYGVLKRTPFVTEVQPEIKDTAVDANHLQHVRICGVLEVEPLVNFRKLSLLKTIFTNPKLPSPCTNIGI